MSADDEDNLDPLLVREQVRRAIERHLVHEDESYERIRLLFTTPHDKDNAPTTKVLRCHLLALEANVARLRKECGGLVQAVVLSEWVGRGDSYAVLFTRFLGNLAVAQSGYIGSIIGMLVDLLGSQKTRRLPDAKPVRENKIHRTALTALRNITQLLPSASTILAQKIAARLDFEFRKANDRMTYVTSFMQLISYVPEVTSDVLTTIMRQLIKLDASIQTELDEQDDEVEDEILQYMSGSQTIAYNDKQRRLSQLSTSSEDDFSVPSDESEDEDEEIDPEVARRNKIKEDVKQVDIIMDTLFNYYSESTRKSSLEMRDDAFEQIISQFNNLILPTYRARHPQFIVFHFAQADPSRVDRFVTNCIGMLLDSRLSPIIRHAAAAYFSGFVGRGAQVAPSLVVDCMDLLCSQLDELRLRYEPKCQAPDLKRFGDFYAMFQAVMYIFCFRWKDIGRSAYDEEDSDIEDEDRPYQLPPNMYDAMRAAIYSRLNPLRVCSPEIVEQFAKLTMDLSVFYIYPKIDENKRVRVNTSWRSIADLDINQPSMDMSWVGDDGVLEGYFPFDPYSLPISKRWLTGDYVEWQGTSEDEEEESDGDSIDIDSYDHVHEFDVGLKSEDDSM